MHLGDSDLDIFLMYEPRDYKIRRVIRNDKYYDSGYQAKLYEQLDNGEWDCLTAWPATDDDGDPLGEDELVDKATILLHDYKGEPKDGLRDTTTIRR